MKKRKLSDKEEELDSLDKEALKLLEEIERTSKREYEEMMGKHRKDVAKLPPELVTILENTVGLHEATQARTELKGKIENLKEKILQKRKKQKKEPRKKEVLPSRNDPKYRALLDGLGKTIRQFQKKFPGEKFPDVEDKERG